MESLYSNRPQRVPNTRLSGFTCCKSGEVLLITGRSYLKACLKTTHKQDEGWERWCAVVRVCFAAQRARDGTGPAALTLSEGFLSELSGSAPLMKSSCSKHSGEGEHVFQNEIVWTEPTAFVSLLINITSTVEVGRPNGRHPFVRDREANRRHVTSASLINAVATFPHSQLLLKEIYLILNSTLMKMPNEFNFHAVFYAVRGKSLHLNPKNY